MTISYTLGAAGAGGVGAANGTAGGTTTVTFNRVTLTATGGGGGIYNSATANVGGTGSGGDLGVTGGKGGAATGDQGGGGGGAIGGTVGSPPTGGAGGAGGQSADVVGLQAAVTGGLGNWTGVGAGATAAATTPNAMNGGDAVGGGCGGGGAGYYGGNGGAAQPGGGGGGAAGYTAVQTGGAGGQGAVVLQFIGAATPCVVLLSGTTYTVPANTTAVRIWAVGAGGGGAGSPATDATSGGGGAAGGVAMMTATAFSPTPTVTLVSSSVPTVTANAITMPAHNEGDVLVMYVHSSALNTISTVPAAGGTVPTWNVLKSTSSTGTSYSCARLVWCVGTGTTTSGTWTNADMFEVAVLRGADTAFPIGGNAISVPSQLQTSTAPAITFSNSDGSSQLLHFHGWGDAVNAVGTISAAPAGGYTQQISTKPSTILGGVINTKYVTTTDGAVANGATGVVYASAASVEVVARGLVIDGAHQTSATGLFVTSTSTYLASSGADVFVALSTAVSSAHTLSSITYNGVAMTLVAGPLSHSPSINSYLGYTWLYRAAGAGTGSAASLVITFSTTVWCCVDVFSYLNVASIGTAVNTFGDSVTPSIGPVTANPGERILAVIGGGSTRVASISAPVGGMNRALTQTSTSYASLAVSDAVGLLGSSFYPPVTFSATFNTAQLYSCIAVPLIPYTQQQTIFSTAGTFTYTAPAWARRFEVAALGGGASGDVGGAGFNTGAGGGASSWGTITWERGTDVRVGNETFTVVVGAGGAGPASFGTRQPGGDSTVTALSGASLIVFGGITYNRLDTGHGQTGDAATGITFGGFTLPGGTGGAASGGNAGVYGSGGGGGNGVFAGSTAGGSGSRGYVSIVAYAN